VTGLVDEATSRALQSKLDEVGVQQSMQIVVLQTILTLTGFWDGPADGQWTPELTQALMEFQTALGVEPTGVVDAATLAAFQQALTDLETLLTSTTTSAPAITVAPVRPPTTQASTPTTPVIITSPTTTG
jgi:peptidoglycan hydrolase-like protein with peptidoglycan-binding domain